MKVGTGVPARTASVSTPAAVGTALLTLGLFALFFVSFLSAPMLVLLGALAIYRFRSGGKKKPPAEAAVVAPESAEPAARPSAPATAFGAAR